MTNKSAWLIGLGWLLSAEIYLAARRQPLLSDAVWECEGEFPTVAFAGGAQ